MGHKKIASDRDEQNLYRISGADQKEWERLFVGNNQLDTDMKALQKKWNRPFPDSRAQVRWVEGFFLANDFEPLLIFQNEIAALAVKHKIPKRWIDSLKGWANTGKMRSGSLSFGLPGVQYVGERGSKRQEIVLGPDVDVSNPIVQEYIALLRRLAPENIPPQPQPMKDNKRKLDWRPVWEWEQRRPYLNRKEIASLLNRDYSSVKKKLEELDKEFGPPKR